MTLNRRDLLFGLGGGFAGMALTPVPWKLLDDVSIWTQHRRALPVPARGPVTWKAAACTLCPGGCALRVRCVGPRPVSLVGEPGHPLGGGACAFGLTLHHLAYHPLRLVGPARRVGERLEPVALDAAVATIVAAIAAADRDRQSVMVIDRRPGRVVSQAWRELLSGLPGGVYATVPGEEGTLSALGQACPLGIDLERTRTLLSFGAPVLDGWGRPGRLLGLRPRLRVVQVDAWRSPSAALADEWLPCAPGSEGALALALAHMLVAADPARAPQGVRAALAAFAPQRLAQRIGLEPQRIESLARTLGAGLPAVAVGGGEAGAGPLAPDSERAIALLNVVLGSVGSEGGIVARRPLPEAGPGGTAAAFANLADVQQGSVRVAILDAADDGRALPWPLLARTLAKGALVVSLSAFDGPLARRASLVVPAPAPLEGLDEVLPTADAAVASYGLSQALLPPPAGALDAISLVRRLADAAGASVSPASHEQRVKQRVAAILASGRGRLLARTAAGYEEARPGDADAAFDLLAQGGVWIDAREPSALDASRCPLPSAGALEAWARPAEAAADLALVAFAARGVAGSTPVSPLLTKLYQESDLRTATRLAAIHPRTAAMLGLREGHAVRVESSAGCAVASLSFDERLAPGRVAIAAGPEPSALHPEAKRTESGALALAVPGQDGTWRQTRVCVREA
jgi:hypothetical protein